MSEESTTHNYAHDNNATHAPTPDPFIVQHGKCVIGVCVMDIKAQSRPMQHILQRINCADEFEIIFFGDECILNKSVEEWPLCDCLISFDSIGFPIDKALQYYGMHKPYCINNLFPQREYLVDRARIFARLAEFNVPTPPHIIIRRQSNNNGSVGETPDNASVDSGLIENDDYIEYNGVRLEKPFIEKPLDADDHNINVYFPRSRGGGCRQMFRKTANTSSVYDPNVNRIRRDGSYMYEQFLETNGRQDIKVYTVGDSYAHAEARKSPTVDGIVERDEFGKEKRHVIQLTESERQSALAIYKAFDQFVCGFDVLRVGGTSYVCDVNGWSFVKGNAEYYDTCARHIRERFIHEYKKRKSTQQ
eukprot:GEZU01042179.1.p1 GENE.GEZU01042179.1~~GEZU01042179.1.p1  ORF type:complete len:361 (+),score=34.25 GEZU01042179.1:74-1156(+)